MFLKIENAGELDIKGLMLMGASTKRNDKSKIGEYGTGWKYAIACLLRNDISFDVFIGEHLVSIETKRISMGGDLFDEVIIDHEHARFTTDMGKDWELWMAVREIFCNSLDEPEHHISEVRDAEFVGEEGKTVVYIDIDDRIQKIIDNWETYFSFNRNRIVHVVEGMVTVYMKLNPNKSYIYRKGIRVAVIDRPGCYDYDFEDITINELRQSDHSYVLDKLKSAMTHSFNSEVLEKIMKTKDCWEQKITFYGFEHISNKESWKGAIAGRTVTVNEYHGDINKQLKAIDKMEEESFIAVPFQLAKIMSDQLPETYVLGMNKDSGTILITTGITDEQNELIAWALDMLEGYDLIEQGEYLVSVANFKNSYLNSTIDGNTIILNRNLFEKTNKGAIEYIITIEMFRQITYKKYNLRPLTDELEQYLFEQLFDTFM